MSRPLFGITAACRLDITSGSSSRAAYFALVAQYQFGTPIISNRAPAELATALGITLYSSPADPGLSASIPGVVVVSFPYATPSVVVSGVAYPVSTAVTGGTLVGVNYVDANGVLYPDVDWQWNISVEAYQNSATGNAGKLQAEVVSWTGDGTANRLIPTTTDLSSGVVAIWGCGGADGTGTNDGNFFRHNQASMAGTAVMGISTDPFTTQGIMSFGATGFTVTAGASSLTFANTLNCKYVAVILRDTTTNNRYLRVGTYKGTTGGAFTVLATHGSTAVQYFSGTLFSSYYDGQTVQDGAGNAYTFHFIDANNGTISPAYVPATANPVILSFTGTANRTITFGGVVGSIATAHLWIWGSSVAYRSSTFPGISSVTLQSGASGHAPVDTMITALGTGSFTITDAVNVNQSVNTFNSLYDYLALSTDALMLAANFFYSFASVGSGAPPTVVAGLPFQPALIFGRQGGAVYTDGAVWKGSTHTGANSTYCSKPGATNNINANGISAIGAASASFQIIPAPSGDPFWSWMFTGGTLTVPADPIYTLVPPVDVAPAAPPSAGPVPPGIPGDGGSQACRVGVAITPSV